MSWRVSKKISDLRRCRNPEPRNPHGSTDASMSQLAEPWHGGSVKYFGPAALPEHGGRLVTTRVTAAAESLVTEQGETAEHDRVSGANAGGARAEAGRPRNEGEGCLGGAHHPQEGFWWDTR